VTATEVRTSLVAVATFVAAVLVLDSTGVLSPHGEVVVDDLAQLAGGGTAAVLCALTARRTRGAERTWRWLMAVGMGGWTVGQAFWSWYQIVSHTPLPSPSMADVGYLTLPVFALPALLTFDVAVGRDASPTRVHDRAIFLLDGAIVVGSLFVLTWATALGAVVHAGSPNALALGVAIAYPLTDLVLVAIVVLLVATRRAPRPLRPQLWLLGSGLVGLSVSDSIFAYLVSSGADDMPPLTNAGFIAGPLLIAVAARTTAQHHALPRHARRLTTMDRAHLLLPYVLVGVTGSVVALQSALGDGIDAVETLLIWIVLVLVLARQVITLLENAVLLDRLSASQVELSRKAHHDPLTGLANRGLFSDRLQEAIDRHQRLSQPFAVLVIDLDDFKAVNDALGHQAGDHLLYAVAQRLRRAVRSVDTVARLGGDEFAIVLVDDAEASDRVAERLLGGLREPFHVAGHTISLGASVGVVEPRADEAGVTPDVLVNRADRAMYAGKREGKGVAVRYRPGLGTLPGDVLAPARTPRPATGHPVSEWARAPAPDPGSAGQDAEDGGGRARAGLVAGATDQHPRA
jgi:diguanylate cyclase (GGDEF)-like protein